MEIETVSSHNAKFPEPHIDDTITVVVQFSNLGEEELNTLKIFEDLAKSGINVRVSLNAP